MNNQKIITIIWLCFIILFNVYAIYTKQNIYSMIGLNILFINQFFIKKESLFIRISVTIMAVVFMFLGINKV